MEEKIESINEAKNQNKHLESAIDKVLDIFLDKKKLAVLCFFLYGLILRITAAVNLRVYADDVNNAIVSVNFFSSGKLTLWHQANSLFYYLVDLSYKIFGTSQFASRFPALVFGSASIILMYLFAKEVFKSEKIGLVCSFLLAVSPWHIKNTLAEMDVSVLFFVLLSGFFLIKALREEKEKRCMFLAGAAMGLGILIKLYALFFAFSFTLFFIYSKRKNFRAHWKALAIFIVVGFLLFTPSIAKNYLLYKDRGIMDFIPTETFGIGKEKAAQFYSWDAGWNKKPDYVGFFTKTKHLDAGVPGGWLSLRYLLYGDPLIFIFGILGFFIAWKKRKEYFIFFLLSFIPIWFYISSVIPMSKHLLFESILVIPLSGLAIDSIHEKLKAKIRLKHILIIILIFQLFWLGVNNSALSSNFYSESAIGKFIGYKQQNIIENSLVLYDPRIYPGRANWMLHDRNFLDISQLPYINEALKNYSSKEVKIDVYFVECAIDDCGWGTIKNQQELNLTIEKYVEFFANTSYNPYNIEAIKQEKINFPFAGKKEVEYRIYSAQLLLKPEVISFAKAPKNWFLYPIGWGKGTEVFDDYQTYNTFDKLINKLAWLIFYMAFISIFILLIYVFYKFIAEK